MATGVQWIDAYPDAKSYVCPGGMEKFPDITYTQVSARTCQKGYMHILTLHHLLQLLDMPWHMCKMDPRIFRSCLIWPLAYV